jgi:hypothetical protein
MVTVIKPPLLKHLIFLMAMIKIIIMVLIDFTPVRLLRLVRQQLLIKLMAMLLPIILETRLGSRIIPIIILVVIPILVRLIELILFTLFIIKLLIQVKLWQLKLIT